MRGLRRAWKAAAALGGPARAAARPRCLPPPAPRRGNRAAPGGGWAVPEAEGTRACVRRGLAQLLLSRRAFKR